MLKRIRYFGVDATRFETEYETRQDAIVAMAKLFLNDYGETYVKFLEVAKDKRGRGYGPRLMAEVFRRAARHGHTLVLTPYTELGREYLLPHQERLERRHYPRLQVVHEQYC